ESCAVRHDVLVAFEPWPPVQQSAGVWYFGGIGERKRRPRRDRRCEQSAARAREQLPGVGRPERMDPVRKFVLRSRRRERLDEQTVTAVVRNPETVGRELRGDGPCRRR